MKIVIRHMGNAALILGGFAIVGTTLVALTFTGTKAIIAQNEQEALLKHLHALVPADRYDNQLSEDTIQVTDPEALGTPEPVPVYRARKQGKPVALFATPVAPDGYSGPIRLLIGVYANGTLAGVRVLHHKETPGLGDAIELARSDWILSFTGQSLGNPASEDWAVTKDGGAFDQFTGATITSRAVVKGVHNFLVYFETHRERLFAVAHSANQEGKK